MAMSGLIQEATNLPGINPKFRYGRMSLFRARSDAALKRSKSFTDTRSRIKSFPETGSILEEMVFTGWYLSRFGGCAIDVLHCASHYIFITHTLKHQITVSKNKLWENFIISMDQFCVQCVVICIE